MFNVDSLRIGDALGCIGRMDININIYEFEGVGHILSMRKVTLVNVGDLRRNSGECQGGSCEYGVVGAPKFARIRMKARARLWSPRDLAWGGGRIFWCAQFWVTPLLTISSGLGPLEGGACDLHPAGGEVCFATFFGVLSCWVIMRSRKFWVFIDCHPPLPKTPQSATQNLPLQISAQHYALLYIPMHGRWKGEGGNL